MVSFMSLVPKKVYLYLAWPSYVVILILHPRCHGCCCVWYRNLRLRWWWLHNVFSAKPKSMRININGKLVQKGVVAKDVALYLMSKLTTSGATGYFVEYLDSSSVRICRWRAVSRFATSHRDGLTWWFCRTRWENIWISKVANFPKGKDWDKAVAYWKTLKSGDDAVFDKELNFDGEISNRASLMVQILVWVSVSRNAFLLLKR